MKTIGLDLGTSALKGVLFDGEKIVAESAREVTFIRDGDMVEIAPQAHWADCLSLIRELAAASDEPVAAIAMAAASGNTLVAAPDGTPKTNIISWLDKRPSPIAPIDLHELVGWPWNGGFPLVHCAWFKANCPEVFGNSGQLFMNNDWLAFLLCGKRGLDHSSATPFFLQDQAKGEYAPSLLAAAGVSISQLSPLYPPGTAIGTLKPELAGGNLTTKTVIATGSFDHPSAARAVHVTEPGDVLVSCGTSWVGFTPIPERRVRKGYLCDPFLSSRGGPWGEIFSIARIGLSLEETIVRLAGKDDDRYKLFNDMALSEDGEARKTMLETIDKFKARLEGRPRRLVMVGGPSEGAGWRHFLAERLELEVEASPFAKQAGAVGAAMLAIDATRQ
jgi:sugar (pentulose or hexulose) kinase